MKNGASYQTFSIFDIRTFVYSFNNRNLNMSMTLYGSEDVQVIVNIYMVKVRNTLTPVFTRRFIKNVKVLGS